MGGLPGVCKNLRRSFASVGRPNEIMHKDGDFIEGPEYIVVTNNPNIDTGAFCKTSVKTKDDLPKVKRLGIIGGGDLNGRLAKLGAIDEVILDIEPITLGSGIRLFGDHDIRLNLELAKSRRIGEGTVQNHYTIAKEKTNA